LAQRISSGVTIDLWQRPPDAQPGATSISVIMDNAAAAFSREIKEWPDVRAVEPIYLPA
jgi:hypothetical protein